MTEEQKQERVDKIKDIQNAVSTSKANNAEAAAFFGMQQRSFEQRMYQKTFGYATTLAMHKQLPAFRKKFSSKKN